MAFDRKAYMKKYHTQWYENNKVSLLAGFKEYAADNAVGLKAYKNRWYASNRAKCLAKADAQYRNNRPARLAYNLKKLYGLSVADYEALLSKQEGACAICKRISKRRLSVDHCHVTKKVRGLLCHKCNFAIGLFQDDTSLLNVAANYLKESI